MERVRGILPDWAALTIAGCCIVAMAAFWFILFTGWKSAWIALGLAVLLGAAGAFSYRREA
jgi:hypothetical protein